MTQGDQDAALRRLIGLADCFELLCAAFSYPTADLAQALVDGRLREDALSCLSDAGASEHDLRAVDRALGDIANYAREAYGDFTTAAPALEKEMRGRYTMLFLAPGANVPVFPYESAFLSVTKGQSSVPTLFISPVTLDVESQMRGAGVIPQDIRNEPADSVWNELSFLSYLYGNAAKQCAEGPDDPCWIDELATFLSEHGEKWLPAFMEETIAQGRAVSQADPYSAFARLGLATLSLTKHDTREDQ